MDETFIEEMPTSKQDDDRFLTRLWDWKDVTLMLILFGVIFIIGQVAAIFLAGMEFDLTTGEVSNTGDTFLILVYGLIGSFVAMVIPYFLVNLMRKRHSFVNLGFRPLLNGWGWTSVWLGIAAALIRMAIGAGLLQLFPSLVEGAEDLSEMFTFDLPWQMAVAGALATFIVPIYEEIFFRGILHNALGNRLGIWGTILISSALFGLFHIIPIQIITAFLLGLVLGWLYEKTNSLWAPILCHLVNNGLAMGLSMLSFWFGWGI